MLSLSLKSPLHSNRTGPGRQRSWNPVRLAVRILVSLVLILAVAGVMGASCISQMKIRQGPYSTVYKRSVRRQPARFPKGTHMPRKNEMLTCGEINVKTFLPARDLVRVEDSRVWWESDNNRGSEDDHMVYKTVAEPLRKVINLVSKRGGRLKVYDAYRPTGVHLKTSLHKEGRAVDFTCDGMSLETLAKLCWAAGFDWVYYEAGGKAGGEHIHCSMKM